MTLPKGYKIGEKTNVATIDLYKVSRTSNILFNIFLVAGMLTVGVLAGNWIWGLMH